MRTLLVPILLGLALSSCSTTYSQQAGTLRPDGQIEPCHAETTDAQACGNAIFNAPRLAKIEVGMPAHTVLEIMQHRPESTRTWLEHGLGPTIEVWNYIWDYELRKMTMITFRDGKVVAIQIADWQKP